MGICNTCTTQVLFLLVLTVLVPHLTHACGRGSIYITNNEYRQILIAIGDNVPEDSRLLNRIRTIFTQASAFLYQVTKKRAMFGEITVLVPETWEDKPEYLPAGTESIDKSDILVDPPDARFNHGDQPFVIKTTPCGELGYYMHLTPDYILLNTVASQYGDYDKTLIHEWAHLRYGVYNEYPSEDGGVHFYAASHGDLEATRCSASITGTMYNYRTGRNGCDFDGNLPDEDCRFRDSTSQTGSYGSLMYRQYLDNVMEFCDNDPSSPNTLHNPEAPTLQNQMCAGRSVWEVLREHPDFAVYNQPREISDTTPEFRFVRKKDANRFVLVLDVSGSMRAENAGNKIGKLGQGCSNFISNIVRDGEKVGIVIFNGTAYAMKELTEVSTDTRTELLDAIPTSAAGYTSIGGGILEGLNMLSRDSNTTGGILIVVSDGAETRAPWIRDVWNETIEAGVTLHSIAMTDAADSNMDAISIVTGGLPFLYDVSDQSNALNEAFQTIGELTANSADKQYTIKSVSTELSSSGGDFTDTLSIDPSLGRNTVFIIDYSGPDIEISLTSPSGDVYNQSSSIVQHDTVFGIYRFEIPGTAEEGEWSFTVINTDSSSQRVAVSVTSQSAVQGQYPIVAQAFWAKRNMDQVVPGPNPDLQILYASVSQGYAPVLGAEVVATVDRPSGASSVDVVLLDNGAGADITKNDGIYSAYFLHFNAQGRYNVKVSVNSSDTTVVSPRRIIGQGAATPPDTSAQQAANTPTGSFQRTASGGSFELATFTADPSGKLYAPSRIIDLKVIEVSYDNLTVTLEWTAVGAELDSGTASEYELRYGDSYEAVQVNFTSLPEVTEEMVLSGDSLLQPLPAGSTQTLVILLPTRGDITYAFGVIALDNDGRNVSSELSNIVTASLKYFPPTSSMVTDDSTGFIIGGVMAGLVGLSIMIGLACVVNNYCRNRSLAEGRGMTKMEQGQQKLATDNDRSRHQKQYKEKRKKQKSQSRDRSRSRSQDRHSRHLSSYSTFGYQHKAKGLTGQLGIK